MNINKILFSVFLAVGLTTLCYAQVSLPSNIAFAHWDTVLIKVSGGQFEASNGDFYTFKDSNDSLLQIGNGTFIFERYINYMFVDDGIATQHKNFIIRDKGAMEVDNEGVRRLNVWFGGGVNSGSDYYFYQCADHGTMKGMMNIGEPYVAIGPDSPLEGESGVPLSATLGFYNSINSRSTADTFQIQMSTDGFQTLSLDTTFASNLKEPGIISFKTPVLKPLTKYYWKVRGGIGEDFGKWSHTWDFTTADVLIQKISLLHPNSNADILAGTTDSTSTSFKWLRDEYATHYQLQIKFDDSLVVDTSGIFNTIDDTLNTNHFGFKNPGSIAWRVRGTNPEYNKIGEWSDFDGFNFKRRLLTPKVNYPSNEEVNVGTTSHYSWTEVPFVWQFRVQVAENINDFKDNTLFGSDLVAEKYFGAPEVIDGYHVQPYVATLEPNKTYYWRLRADEKPLSLFVGSAAWSDTVMFTTGTRTSIGDELLPNKYLLNQNYPNPFNPSTQIHYALPEATHVTLEVFNSVGQKVMKLVNGQKTAGYHTATFDATGLSSGVYLYKLSTQSFTETKKMLLVK